MDSLGPKGENGERVLTAVFLVALAAAWVAVFLPAAMRARQTTPYSTAERFKRRMQLIAPRSGRGGRWVVVPESNDRLARSSFRRGQDRRRKMFVFLAVATAVSFVLASVGGGALWEIHIAFAVSLGLYVALLLEAKRRRVEKTDKVRSIGAHRVERSPFGDVGRFEDRAQAVGGRRA